MSLTCLSGHWEIWTNWKNGRIFKYFLILASHFDRISHQCNDSMHIENGDHPPLCIKHTGLHNFKGLQWFEERFVQMFLSFLSLLTICSKTREMPCKTSKPAAVVLGTVVGLCRDCGDACCKFVATMQKCNSGYRHLAEKYHGETWLCDLIPWSRPTMHGHRWWSAHKINHLIKSLTFQPISLFSPQQPSFVCLRRLLQHQTNPIITWTGL